MSDNEYRIPEGDGEVVFSEVLGSVSGIDELVQQLSRAVHDITGLDIVILVMGPDGDGACGIASDYEHTLELIQRLRQVADVTEHEHVARQN